MENLKESAENVILIPTDFSEVCDNAIAHGVDLAEQIGFSVTLLHVINKDTSKYLKDNNLQESDLDGKFAEVVKKFKRGNVQIDFVIRFGDIFNEIADIATEINASLVILGTHGKVGFQKITGSFAMKVIQSTQIPTIVVQKYSTKREFKKIVFPITASTEDRQKVKWAIYISKIFDATIYLFPKYESEAYRKRKIMSVTKQIKNILDTNDVTYVDKVSEEGAGNFAKQIIEYGMEVQADLMMILVSKATIFDTHDEQIVFNTAQIPVVCINPVKLNLTSWR